jgi:Outer membrane protein beta-barrel domain
MMKCDSTVVCLFVMLATCSSIAQDHAPLELTGAYQFLRSYNVNVPLGWDASINWSANNWLGVVGDFGGATKSQSGVTGTLYTFGGGPQFTLRTSNIDPYFRVVIGAAHGQASGFGISGSTTAFFVSPGGGVDFRASDHLWFRLGANYPVVRKFGVTADGVQALVGITYKFGHRREAASAGPNPTTDASTGVVPHLGAVVESKLRVVRFLPGSVLFKHGMELGDVIDSVNDSTVKTLDELNSALSRAGNNVKVKIGFLSRGQWQTWIEVQI